MKKTRTDAGIFLIIAIVLLLSGGIIAAVLTLRSDPVEEALSDDRVINVLFVIEKSNKPLGAYVLMYYPATKRAAVFDIPGDVGLIIKRLDRVDRIDKVYDSQKIAEYIGEAGGLLDVDIDFSVIITAENLRSMVDLLEGVDIFIPAPIGIEHEGEAVLFPSGLCRLDGNKAAQYFSYDNPDDNRDTAAARRQRFFIALLKRLGEKNESLKNPAVTRIYQSLLDTNMSPRTRSRLFDEFAAIDTERISIQAVGGNLREVSGQTLLLPHYDGSQIKEIVRQTLGGLTRQIEGSLRDRVFTVEILNGTTVSGLAGRTAELLRGFGYDVISTGNADTSNYEKTIIFDRSGYDDVAHTFAGVIRCRNVQSEAPPADDLDMDFSIHNFEYRSDFTLIIGRDFDGRYVSGN